MSDPITHGDLLRLAANESIISATLKWAAANGRRLNKADLERMGAGVDSLVAENERLTKERDDAIALLGCYKLDKDDLKARVKQLESEWSGWPALQREWFGDRYAAMQPWDAVRARIEDSEARVKQLEAVTNDPHALWTNWLRGDVKLPVRIGDVRQYQDRVKRLEEAGDRLRKYLRIAVGPDATGWETPHGVDIGKRVEAAITSWINAKEAKP